VSKMIGFTGTEGRLGTNRCNSWSTLLASVKSAMMNLAMCASETVSTVSRVDGLSKSNMTGSDELP
jgi:hypothetical protein